jgi:DeoR/GlpR family transcriptional regulator of sugar metabolism
LAFKERHAEILKILSRRKTVSVQSLTQRLEVSEVTIRKDLTLLEEQGKLMRTHGGAILSEDAARLRALPLRQHENTEAKRAIARRARALIREGDIIYLDAGSTCAADLKRKAIACAERKVILADCTKYGQSASAVFARAEDVDMVVTDPGFQDLGEIQQLVSRKIQMT